MTAVSIAWADLAHRFTGAAVVIIGTAAIVAAVRWWGGRTLRDLRADVRDTADRWAEVIGR